MPHARRAGSKPDRRHHRQPERQERGKRGVYDPHGYDAGKKIRGKKRHVLVDTQGLLMAAIVHAADIQDRDGGVMLTTPLFELYPFVLKLYADSGYQGVRHRTGRIARFVERAGNIAVADIYTSDLAASHGRFVRPIDHASLAT